MMKLLQSGKSANSIEPNRSPTSFQLAQLPSISAVLACAFLLSLGGCANIMSIHRSESLNDKTTLTAIDAKQRVVISAKRPHKDNNGETRVCAEPSPDALQAIASSLGANVSDVAKAVGLQSSISESSASIGLRTQSIQILRDAMYRACEGYLGGALDDNDFESIHRRYQSVMLGLLAIEQLTGAVTAKQVILGGGSARAASGEQAEKAAEEWASAKGSFESESAALEALQAKLKTAKDARDKKGTAATEADNTAVTTIEAEIKAQASKVAEAKKNLGTREDVLAVARARLLTQTAGATGAFGDASSSSRVTGSDSMSVKYLSDSVADIVRTIAIAGFGTEECFGIFKKHASTQKELPVALTQYCSQVLTAKARAVENLIQKSK